MYDGKSIVSGWTDGKIRAFLPQSGRLAYVINAAHKTGGFPTTGKGSKASIANAMVAGGVSCISTSFDCLHLLSGGSDCEVRCWYIGKQTQKLLKS
jgi:hypothetical protein